MLNRAGEDAYYLYFDRGYINSSGDRGRGDGYSIRAIAETDSIIYFDNTRSEQRTLIDKIPQTSKHLQV